MGYFKRLSEGQSEVRRFNAARRRSERFNNSSSQLIRLDTISDIERYDMAKDAERLTEFNREIEKWQDKVALQLRAAISSHSLRVAKELTPKAYTDSYGIINRIGFTFPRHGIYIHKGAGKGHGGYIGSKWNLQKIINGIPIDTGIVRHTNFDSKGKQNDGKRKAFRWFDPVIKNHISELADIVTKYFDTMIIDATRIYIEK